MVSWYHFPFDGLVPLWYLKDMRITCPRCDGSARTVGYDDLGSLAWDVCGLCEYDGEITLPPTRDLVARFREDESCRLGQCEECRDEARLREQEVSLAA